MFIQDIRSITAADPHTLGTYQPVVGQRSQMGFTLLDGSVQQLCQKGIGQKQKRHPDFVATANILCNIPTFQAEDGFKEQSTKTYNADALYHSQLTMGLSGPRDTYPLRGSASTDGNQEDAGRNRKLH